MVEHTPTPWRVEEGTDLIWGACNSDDQSTYGMGYSIVEGKSGSWNKGRPDMDEREANAAFIIKAVNRDHHFDALVKALEAIDDLDEQGRLGRIAREALDALLPTAADVRGILGGSVGGPAS